MSLPDKSAGSGRFEAARYRFLPVPFSDMTTSQGSVPTRLGSLVGSSIIIFTAESDGEKKFENRSSIFGEVMDKNVVSFLTHCVHVHTQTFLPRDAMHSVYYVAPKCPSAPQSVCLSHAGILSKWLNISSNFFQFTFG